MNLGKLIKVKNQLESIIFHIGQDYNGLELLVKTKRRSSFIQNAKFNFYLYRFEPNEFIELVGENETSKHAALLNKLQEEEERKYNP